MKRNKLKCFFMSSFILFFVSIAHTQPAPQTATITLVNASENSSYSIFDYITQGGAYFLNQPSLVPPHESVTIHIVLNTPQSIASVKFRDSVFKDCIMNPEDLRGKCGEIKFIYDENSGAPGAELDNNLRHADACIMGFDYVNHHSYVKCITNFNHTHPANL